MRQKMITAVAVFVALFATTSHAADLGGEPESYKDTPISAEEFGFKRTFYAEFFGGWAFADDLDYGSGTFEMEDGYNIGGAIGVNLDPNWAVEVEGTYVEMGYECCRTHLSGLSIMANAIYTLHNRWLVNPYVGAGIGMTRVRYDGGNQFPSFTGDEWKFGYQLMAGAIYDISQRVGIFAEYRFQDVVDDATIQGVPNIEYQSHNVSIGLRVNF